MKKIAIVLMTLLLMTTSVMPVFAAGNFVYSPPFTDTPILEDVEFTGDCDGGLVVTPYSQLDTLDEDSKTALNGAYMQIKDCDDLGELFPFFKDGDKKIAVGELFDVDFTNCKEHNEHNPFTVTLLPSTVKRFVGVTAYVDGKWVKVDAKLDGNNVIITSDIYGPYAIVLSADDAGEDNPQTGDTFPWIYVVMMGVSAAGLVGVLVALKKKNA